MTPSQALSIACLGALVGAVITSTEFLWLERRLAMSKGGFWPEALITDEISPSRLPWAGAFLSNAALRQAQWLCIAASLAGVACLALGVSPVAPLLVVAAATALTQQRIRWGGEGGDHMTNLILVVGIVGFGLAAIPGVTAASCAFLAAQLTLSYVSSGVAKLFGSKWRSGQAFAEIMDSYTYGNRVFANLLRRRAWVSAVAGHAVMLFQLTFPLYFVAPRPYCYAYLLAGLAFHLSIAVIMRLHLFVYTFVAAYPCLFLVRQWFPW
jgi:hypothetical protein